ncbi:hypothetical protein IFR04_010350 [Cadophora malorum]|uniref:Uncharacterized protein n=1 Tax=Cadophora malorum TaxID=108018 RepID=A0A8H7T7H8_9HELO|nr:hypothetical protein IFR04_010350 [Cadophora malorum]
MSTISSLSSVTAITRTSIHTSASTAALPPICSDPNCLYPFGPACTACSLAFDIKEEAKSRRPRPTETVAAWVEEVKVNRDITVYAGQEFTGGADEGDYDWDVDDVETQAAMEGDVDEDEDEDEGECVSEQSESDGDGYEADEEAEADFDETLSDRTQIGAHVRSPTCTYPDSSSSSQTASISPVSPVDRVREPLSPWLNTVFDHTLKGQLENCHFAGGADVEQDPDVDNCELCGRPLGDPTDQHSLKCKYAHEELERERIAQWGAAWSPRRRK